LIMSQPEKLDADKIFETIYVEPIDAYYKVSDDRKSISIEKEIPGITVDREMLSRAIETLNKNTSVDVTIPLVPVEAAVKRDDLSDVLFQDKLGTASTNFSLNGTNNRNRRDNMVLATGIVSGTILAPGDEFSFNGVVGMRTEAKGYKVAGAFIDGQLIDDVGGGICQVSSTLYNALLYADLNIVNRQHHSYIIGYVMKGFDATVSYPNPDLKFSNSTNHPIKIECFVEGSSITFSIFGTQVGPVKTITFSFETKATINFEKITTEDPDLPLGTTNITQSGRVGYTIDSFKTVQVGDGPKETIKIATNRYKAMPQLEFVGTKPVPESDENPEQVVITPPPGEEDFFVEGGQQSTSDPSAGGQNSGQSGGAEETTTGRPIRTPRPSRVTPDPNDNTDQPTTEASTTQKSTTAQSEPPATTTAAAADPPPATTTADGGEEATSAPKRTPRPSNN